MEEYQVPIHQKVTLTIDEATKYSHIGEHKIRELLKKPQCPFLLLVGKKQLIKRKAFEEYISKSIQL